MEGFSGTECGYTAYSAALNSIITLGNDTELVTIPDTQHVDKVQVTLLSGSDCTLYLLSVRTTGDAIPSLTYHTQSVNLLLHSASFPVSTSVTFLLHTTNPPITLYIEPGGKFHSGSQSSFPVIIIVIIAIVCSAVPVLCIILLLTTLYHKRTHHRQVVPLTFSIVPPLSPTLNPDFSSLLPTQPYGQLLNPMCSSCVVCMEKFTETDAVRVLPCLHVYHSLCLVQLFRRMRKCVLCNRDYPHPYIETDNNESAIDVSTG